MKEFIDTYQTWLLNGCLISLAVIFLIVLLAISKYYFRVWGKSKFYIPFHILTIILIAYGGTKNITTRTSTDENIELYDAYYDVSNVVEVVSSVTNVVFVHTKFTLKVSNTSTLPQPIWYRDSNYCSWTNFNSIASWETEQPVLNSGLSGNGTNVYEWISTTWSNEISHAQYYIGTDLPAVQVDVDDTDYIVLDEFCMTSKKVHIKWHIKADFEIPENTVLEVQRRVENRQWEVVDELAVMQNGVYTWNGFAVGKRTRWRLHMAVTAE